MARQEKNTKGRNILSSGGRITRVGRIPHFLLATILAVAVAGCTGDDKPSAPSAATVNERFAMPRRAFGTCEGYAQSGWRRLRTEGITSLRDVTTSTRKKRK
jgi:hypothetical protein